MKTSVGEKSKWPPPYEFRDRVCGCANSPGNVLHSNGFANACKGCGKYHRFVVFKCYECEKKFLNTFRHPNKCLLNPRCWDHILTQPCEHEHCRTLFEDSETWVREEDRYPLEAPVYTDFVFD